MFGLQEAKGDMERPQVLTSFPIFMNVAKMDPGSNMGLPVGGTVLETTVFI